MQFKKGQKLVWQSERYAYYNGLELVALTNPIADSIIICRVMGIPEEIKKFCNSSGMTIGKTNDFGLEYLKPLKLIKLKFKDILKKEE